MSVSGNKASVAAPIGSYSNLQIAANGCTSVQGVSVNIAVPSAPVLLAAGINPPVCTVDGSIDFTFTNVPD